MSGDMHTCATHKASGLRLESPNECRFGQVNTTAVAETDHVGRPPPIGYIVTHGRQEAGAGARFFEPVQHMVLAGERLPVTKRGDSTALAGARRWEYFQRVREDSTIHYHFVIAPGSCQVERFHIR